RAFNENIVQSMEGGILIEDEAGRITFANPKIGELLECPPEELIGQPWTSIVAPQQDAQLREKTIRRPRTVARRYETLLQTREEREIPVIISARPLFEEGRFTGVLSVLTDITERKQVEELLERERETFFSILQKAPYGVLLIDKDERCLYVNTEFTKITGYVLEDVPNMSVWFQKAYPDPDYRQKVIDTWQGDTAQRISRVFNVTCKDGEVDKEVEFRPTLLDDGRAILVLSDITERKQREAERGRLLAALKRRTTQLLTAAEVSRPASMILDPEELMEHVVNLIEERFDFYYAGLFLLDKSKEYAVLRAGTGAAGQQMIEADHRLRVGGESMIGQCVEDGEARIASDVGRESMHLYNLYLPETRSEMALPLVSRGKCIGALTVQSAELGTFSEEDVAALQAMADHLAIAIQNARLYNAAQREIVERKRVEERLRRRNRELALLNRASQALISTLDLDHVLITVLDEVRHIMDVTACSIWLVDPETEEMVCQQATGPKRDTVQDWRLEPGEGLVGWVMRNGQSLIVPDASVDERYFAGVEQHTGLDLRSILSLPLRIKEEIIGVLQAVDSEANRFDAVHLALLEPLAATAAMAIENARLYEQAHRDAATKSVLLREVNHRVKNNLSAIIGLLHAARRRTEVRDQQAYQSVMKDLINRVRGLVTVHGLLSTSEWGPLPLSQLTAEVIRSSIRTLSKEEHISVDVPPSSVCVTADQAHDLTLVINELTTNTVKHGLREQEAHIAISAGREGDTVRLEFRDNGPGYPQEALEVGGDNVGLDLIDKIVRRNLRGTLSLHNDRGAVAVIRFKSGIQTEGEEKT
ncbi:MAG: GAF domain-containing protein, partial [Anaerolineae bacterium]